MSTFRQCSTPGCLSRAQYVPKICVPPTGYAVEANLHVSVIIGLPLCEDHMVILLPEQIFNTQTRAVIDAFTRNKVQPDYNRAFLLPLQMNTPEYASWERLRLKGKTQ